MLKSRRPRIYYAIGGGFAAVLALAALGVHIDRKPDTRFVPRNSYLVEKDALTASQWNDLLKKKNLFYIASFFPITSGSTATLPSDFNTANNTIHCIGAGAAGSAGVTTTGGIGGGGGAYANILNFSAAGANASVSVQVGSGDTWFFSNTTVLAKAGSPGTAGGCLAGQGGQSSACIGTTKFSGGNGSGGTHCTCGGGGGGGGGAAGPNGTGGNGGTPITQHGGAGDNGFGGAGGNTVDIPGSPGTEWGACPAYGSGGGGGGGIGCAFAGVGANGGSYGGGGGGGAGGTPGTGFQGLIMVQYVSAGASLALMPRQIFRI